MIKRLTRKPPVRRVLLAVVAGAVLLSTVTGVSAAWIRGGADGHLFTEADVPDAPVALVLGTRVGPDGTPSPFLAARLEIARRLFDAGKVRAILVSGDNMNADYNEPDGMRRWLVDRGVPAQKVSGRDPVHLGRHETGVEDALRDA